MNEKDKRKGPSEEVRFQFEFQHRQLNFYLIERWLAVVKFILRLVLLLQLTAVRGVAVYNNSSDWCFRNAYSACWVNHFL